MLTTVGALDAGAQRFISVLLVDGLELLVAQHLISFADLVELGLVHAHLLRVLHGVELKRMLLEGSGNLLVTCAALELQNIEVVGHLSKNLNRHPTNQSGYYPSRVLRKPPTYDLYTEPLLPKLLVNLGSFVQCGLITD